MASERTLWFLLKWVRNVDTPDVVETSWDEDRLRFSARNLISQKPDWVTYSIVSKALQTEIASPND